MSKVIKLALLLLLPMALISCGGNPANTTTSTSTTSAPTLTASFTIATTSPVANQAVQFTDTTTGSPTTWSWKFGDGATSTLQSPTHTYTAAGTFTVTLTASNTSGSQAVSHSLSVAASATGGPAFNMTQTLSDGAQRTTLAFAGLGIMAGDFDAQSFFPPGKVADYTGFQYLRDNDSDNMGHNTSFLTRVASNVIYTLTDAQMVQLAALATAQQSQVDLYGYKRYPLMKAFRRALDNDLPSGSAGLNLNAVKKVSRELYAIDGQISFDRAVLYATIINSLTQSQRDYFDAMKGKGFNSWPDISDSMIQAKMQALPKGSNVLVMTYASDIYSWYEGSLDADVYFCPERHGTYYGSFYMKDAPAVGHEGYSISESLTNTAGNALSDSSEGYVTSAQATLMSSLVDTQRSNLYSGTANIVSVRTQIATLLRSLITSPSSSATVHTQVLALSNTYGDLDGENNYHYAAVFAQVWQSMSTEQKTKLVTLRKSILTGTYSDGTMFDFSICTTPFLYSGVITDSSDLSPYIDNTDYLFFEPTN